MKYIDAEKLIELIDAKLEDLGMSGSVWVGRSVLNELKDDIESLQQEQREVELSEHRIADIIQELFPTNQFIESESLLLDKEEAILFARHFYKLEQCNARKE